MIVNEREREIAKELLREKFEIDDSFSENVQNFIINKLERYTYNNYKYHARKMSYIQYITDLYLYNKGIKEIRKKYMQLLSDIRETQKRLYQKKKVIVREGTRAWAAAHLPPPQTQMQDFLPLFDEIGVAKPIWDSDVGINVKVSYMQKLI